MKSGVTKVPYEENVIVRKSFDFSIDLVRCCSNLRELKEFDISRQLFKAGTSIGSNVMEA